MDIVDVRCPTCAAVPGREDRVIAEVQFRPTGPELWAVERVANKRSLSRVLPDVGVNTTGSYDGTGAKMVHKRRHTDEKTGEDLTDLYVECRECGRGLSKTAGEVFALAERFRTNGVMYA